MNSDTGRWKVKRKLFSDISYLKSDKWSGTNQFFFESMSKMCTSA